MSKVETTLKRRAVWCRLSKSKGKEAIRAAAIVGGCSRLMAGAIVNDSSGHTECTRIIRVRCFHRTCPTCARHRADNMRSRLFKACIEAVQDRKLLGMLTLTVPHSADESFATVRDRLSEAWRKLTRMRQWQRFAWASFRSVEVEHGPNGWHAHMHVIVCYVPGLFKEKLGKAFAELWQRAVGTEAFSHWRPIKTVRDDPGKVVVRKRMGNRWSVKRVSLMKVLQEVTKYVTTPGSIMGLSDDELEDYLKGFRGWRIYQSSYQKRRIHGKWVRESWVSCEELDELEVDEGYFLRWSDIQAHASAELREAVIRALLLEAAELGIDNTQVIQSLQPIDSS